MIADCGRATRLPVTRRRVAPDSVVYSDGWSAYDALPAEGDQRERGNRGEGLVPAGGRPSSGAENFWNRAKRHLRTFNGVPTASFPRFLQGGVWRFNAGTPRERLQSPRKLRRRRMIS